MGLRLAVERDAWARQLERTVAALPGVVPVVKGNGYGFGRIALMPFAVEHTPADGQIAVGTVYEAADVPAGRTPLVLTPHVDALPEGLRTDAVLTVGSGLHVAASILDRPLSGLHVGARRSGAPSACRDRVAAPHA